MAAAALALIERVEPNWLISKNTSDAASAASLKPGPSWPNKKTQDSGMSKVSIFWQPSTLSIPMIGSAPPPAPTVSPFDPSYVDSAGEALQVEDLGEGACNIYEVCTFVNVKVQIDGGCSLGQVFIELFNADDEPYFEEAVDLGIVSKGQVLKFIEVGTDDSDAEYVEVGGFSCE